MSAEFVIFIFAYISVHISVLESRVWIYDGHGKISHCRRWQCQFHQWHWWDCILVLIRNVLIHSFLSCVCVCVCVYVFIFPERILGIIKMSVIWSLFKEEPFFFPYHFFLKNKYQYKIPLNLTWHNIKLSIKFINYNVLLSYNLFLILYIRHKIF